jgi:hypothetical protein
MIGAAHARKQRFVATLIVAAVGSRRSGVRWLLGGCAIWVQDGSLGVVGCGGEVGAEEYAARVLERVCFPFRARRRVGVASVVATPP